MLVLLLALIVFDQWEAVWRLRLDSAILTPMFTGVAISIGWGVGALLDMPAIDRYAFSMGFAVRNVGAAALVAASTLGRQEFVAFGVLFVLYQFPMACRRSWSPEFGCGFSGLSLSAPQEYANGPQYFL